MDYLKKYKQGFTYIDYMLQMQRFKEESNSSSLSHKPGYNEYTSLGYARMKRINKTGGLSEELQSTLSAIFQPIHMLALTESWCGDAAQNLPYFSKMAETSPFFNLKLLYREEHLDLMDLHLTNGGRSIPVVIFLDENFKVMGQWGPRPKFIQERVVEYKKKPNPEIPYSEFQIETQRLYNQDGGKTLSSEVVELLSKILSRNPAV